MSGWFSRLESGKFGNSLRKSRPPVCRLARVYLDEKDSHRRSRLLFLGRIPDAGNHFELSTEQLMLPSLVLKTAYPGRTEMDILAPRKAMRCNEPLRSLAASGRPRRNVVHLEFNPVHSPQHSDASLNGNVELGAERLVEIHNDR